MLLILLDRSQLNQLHERLKNIPIGVEDKYWPPSTRSPLIEKFLRDEAILAAIMKPDGTWHLKGPLEGVGFDNRGKALPNENATYIDLLELIANATGADMNNPDCKGVICTCPTECDCQNPPTTENGIAHISNECPIHNTDPQPSPDCPRHGHNILG